MTTKKSSKNSRASRQNRYAYEFRLRAVNLYLEEGYPTKVLCEELGIGHSTLNKWIKRYREEGEAGLMDRQAIPAKNPSRRINPAIRKKAVELKRQDPQRGVRRIAQVLKRHHLMKVSPETVRKTLQEAGLNDPPVKRKPKRNPQKPRFFERSTPNQLWQSDIFCFRLGGRNAYLVGYIDDYSRYITGMGLYRSQTAEHVIETLRRGVAEYGVPKEMLTDNGRQYTNWRGTTRFERELKKDRIRHIRSQPHHPMTLGKIERFWKSIYAEFLSRVQFNSFEEAQDRLALWVKYYNYKRPHQGIGGLCPADRFFEIQTALRKVLEKGIEENVLEAALRGPPHQPFYMVGRMGDQSVVIRAEKGKVKMLVDDGETGKEKELVYNVNEHNQEEDGAEGETKLCGEGKMRSGALGMERAPEAGGGLPGDGHPVAAAQQLAGPGDEGNDAGTVLETDVGRATGPGAESAGGEAAREGGHAGDAPEPGGSAAGLDPAERGGEEEERLCREIAQHVALLPVEEAAIVLELLEGGSHLAAGRSADERTEREKSGAQEGGSDHESSCGADERDGGGRGAEGQPQDLLQVGTPGPGGDDGGPLRAEPGPSARRLGCREGGAQRARPEAGEGA
jgi:transposase InsO family protein